MSFQLQKISATNLAQLALDNFCPRCFWLKARAGFKNPFALFPKIFNELDGFQKSFTELYWQDNGALPPWLKELGDVEDVVAVPGYGQFGARHECGVDVTGVTDHVFRKLSKKLLILDYKTSRPTGDRMFSMYKAQLSIYAWICPRFGLGEVENMALVYYEPLTNEVDWLKMASFEKGAMDEVGTTPLPSGLKLNFRPYVMKIEPIAIDELLLKAKAIAEDEVLPQPNQFCTECERVMQWMQSVQYQVSPPPRG